jgi:murein DD-endopeptidase MepM/ murein hydrolase activator NlpD
MIKMVIAFALLLLISCGSDSGTKTKPLRKYIALSIGESAHVALEDGTEADIKLLRIEYKRDRVRKAIREARLLVSVDGVEKWIIAGGYNLPVKYDKIKMDCVITSEYLKNGNFPDNMWRLKGKDAKFRVWPVNAAVNPDNMIVIPVDQDWFGCGQTTQALEPVEIDHDNTRPNDRDKIYYHWGTDFAGVRDVTPALAAADGVVISVGKPGLMDAEDDDSYYFKDEPFFNVPEENANLPKPRFDRIFVRMNNGWVYRYSHLQRFNVSLGDTVKAGDVIGTLGNKWSDFAHVHFEIWSIDKDDNNNYILELAYPYLWESYINRHKPKVLAVVGPHRYAVVGDSVLIDATRSVSFEGKTINYEWTFSDGTKSNKPVLKKKYEKPGYYSEILKVTDDRGNVAYDFLTVTVVYDNQPDKKYGYSTVGYYPVFNIKAGDSLLFKGRTFNIEGGTDTWDFGDGNTASTPGIIGGEFNPKYTNIKHVYEKSGHYFVSFKHISEDNIPSICRLSINVK